MKTIHSSRLGGVLAMLALASCGSELTDPGERVACRYIGSSWAVPECRPESEFDLTPQDKPFKVNYEIDRYHGREATEEQRRAADDFSKRSRESAERHGWFNFEQAEADGYRLLTGDNIHYANRKNIFDENILDPEKPEFLLYYKLRDGMTLTGMMYLVREKSEEGPQFGGPLTKWHYHIWSRPACMKDGIMVVAIPDRDGSCKEGSPTRRSAEMIHVWFVEHPDGRFATRMGFGSTRELQKIVDGKAG